MIKEIKLLITASVFLLSGCLATTGTNKEESSSMDTAMDTAASIASTVGSVASGFLGGGEYGTKLTEDQINQIVQGKTTSQEVLEIIGPPIGKHRFQGKETWNYMYQNNGFFSSESQSFVVEFGGDGIVTEAYKSSEGEYRGLLF